jgi:hypothetical protein
VRLESRGTNTTVDAGRPFTLGVTSRASRIESLGDFLTAVNPHNRHILPVEAFSGGNGSVCEPDSEGGTRAVRGANSPELGTLAAWYYGTRLFTGGLSTAAVGPFQATKSSQSAAVVRFPMVKRRGCCWAVDLRAESHPLVCRIQWVRLLSRPFQKSSLDPCCTLNPASHSDENPPESPSTGDSRRS